MSSDTCILQQQLRSLLGDVPQLYDRYEGGGGSLSVHLHCEWNLTLLFGSAAAGDTETVAR